MKLAGNHKAKLGKINDGGINKPINEARINSAISALIELAAQFRQSLFLFPAMKFIAPKHSFIAEIKLKPKWQLIN